MKKILIAILMLIPVLCFAGPQNRLKAIILKNNVINPGFAWEVSDLFNRTESAPITGWTYKEGAGFTTNGTQLVWGNPWNTYYIRNSTALANAYRQFAKVQIVVVTTAVLADGATSILFRCLSDFSYSYRLRFCSTGVVFTDEGGTNIGSAWTVTVGNTYWVAGEVENTGNDTIFRAWVTETDPGNRADWGVAGATWTDNPSSASNTGLYVGLHQYGSSPDAIFDNFYASSSAGAP